MPPIPSSIQEALRSLAANQYVGLIGALLSAASLLYALFAFRKTKPKRPRIAVGVGSTNLVHDREALFPGLAIAFQGKSLATITSSVIGLWNSGSQVIRSSDIAAKEPLAIRIVKGEILDHRILKNSNAASTVSTKAGDGTITIDFDYFEPGDRIVLQVLHTGPDSGALQIEGTVIGAKGAIKTTSELDLGASAKFIGRWPRLSMALVFTTVLIFFLLVLFAVRHNLIVLTIVAIPTLIIFVMWIALLWRFRKPVQSRPERTAELMGELMARAMAPRPSSVALPSSPTQEPSANTPKAAEHHVEASPVKASPDP
jgi:hypothetical protein